MNQSSIIWCISRPRSNRYQLMNEASSPFLDQSIHQSSHQWNNQSIRQWISISLSQKYPTISVCKISNWINIWKQFIHHLILSTVSIFESGKRRDGHQDDPFLTHFGGGGGVLTVIKHPRRLTTMAYDALPIQLYGGWGVFEIQKLLTNYSSSIFSSFSFTKRSCRCGGASSIDTTSLSRLVWNFIRSEVLHTANALKPRLTAHRIRWSYSTRETHGFTLLNMWNQMKKFRWRRESRAVRALKARVSSKKNDNRIETMRQRTGATYFWQYNARLEAISSWADLAELN